MDITEEEKKHFLEGTVEHITYYQPTNGFTIFTLIESGEDYKVLGYFPHEIRIGDCLRVEGYIRQHPKWGQQFHVTDFTLGYPLTENGIRQFLVANVNGIGRKRAERLVAKYGKQTLDILETNPELVIEETPGLSAEQKKYILETFQNDMRSRRILVALSSLGLSPQMASKLYEKYGEDIYDRIRENPYLLIDEVTGIGFKRADALARSSGLQLNSPYRISAGLVFTLKQASLAEGHIYLPYKEWLLRASSDDVLGIPVADIEQSLANDKISKEEFILYQDRAYLSYYWMIENKLAMEIKRIIGHASETLQGETLPAFVHDYEFFNGIKFSDKQKQFLSEVLTHKMIILTGGPGTGKTTLLSAVTEIFERHTMKVLSCAPTGRAARRMASSTGRAASTIHRLLEYNPTQGFQRNDEVPLDVDVLIIDEISMVDISLAYYLFRAIPSRTRIILVGDADQLPSIQPGNFFMDMLRYESVPSIELDFVFRQKVSSRILLNAHRIRKGKPPLFNNEPEGDFFFMEVDDPIKCENLIVELVSERLPEHYQFDPIRDIQVLSPMYKGTAGVDHLNILLQDKLNPRGSEIRIQNRLFRSGDKIMQLKNNYEDMVFNGDSGILVTFGSDFEALKQNTPNAQLKLSFMSYYHSLPIKKKEKIENNFISFLCLTVIRDQASKDGRHTLSNSSIRFG